MKLSPRIFTNVLQPIRMSVPRSYFSIQHLRKLNPEYKIATHLFEMNLRKISTQVHSSYQPI